MGNKICCCTYHNNTDGHGSQRSGVGGGIIVNRSGGNILTNHNGNKIIIPSSFDEHLAEGEVSVNNLQHISEREQDEMNELDPSQHPMAKTIFMERSMNNSSTINNITNITRKKSLNLILSNNQSNTSNGSNLILSSSSLLKKSSSCSTIYLDDSTVSQPNLKNTVKCVALAIYYHIKNRTSDRQLDIFDERLHPLTRNTNGNETTNVNVNPEHKQIYKFVRTLFNSAQLTAECAIITLVYLERLLTYAELDIGPTNWKRIVLGAILLASKVWDDQAVWNVDYCQILKDITVEDMNELERQFLELIQFNINVPSSVYAKYYFDLRTLAEANDLSFSSTNTTLEPLSKERAQKLEAMSYLMQDKLTNDLLSNQLKKWNSLDNVYTISGITQPPRRSVAILS